MLVDSLYRFLKKVALRSSVALTGVFMAVSLYGQVGDYDVNMRIRDTLEVIPDFMVSDDTTIWLTDLSYHEFSADRITWRKGYVLGDQYIRISNNAKYDWVILDLFPSYWTLGEDSNLYVNTDYANRVFIDTTAAPDNFNLWVNGDVNGDYYFLNGDSLTHTNIYNGGDGADGMFLRFSGDTAVWANLPSGFGETNIAENVGTRGIGVFEQKTDTLLEFRNIASLTPLLLVTLDAQDSVIDLDLALPTITAGVGLTGGGSMESAVTINFNIPTGFPSFNVDSTLDAANDWIVMYDVSDGTHYKIHPENLLDEIGVYSAGLGLSLTGSEFYLDTPATVSDTSTNRVSASDHSHALTIFELISVVDVTDSPVSGQYLKWNGTSWVTDSPGTGTSVYVDLYVDSALVESQINKLNLVAGQDIKLTYLGNGGVRIDYDWSVQEFSTTSVALDVTQYRNAIINMAGATTVTLSNLIAGITGNISVLGTGSASTIEFSGGYTYVITPCLTHTGDVVDTSGNVDNLSYYYDGEKVFINGTYSYE